MSSFAEERLRLRGQSCGRAPGLFRDPGDPDQNCGRRGQRGL